MGRGPWAKQQEEWLVYSGRPSSWRGGDQDTGKRTASELWKVSARRVRAYDVVPLSVHFLRQRQRVVQAVVSGIGAILVAGGRINPQTKPYSVHAACSQDFISRKCDVAVLGILEDHIAGLKETEGRQVVTFVEGCR